MHKGHLVPYLNIAIETESTPDAIDKAKKWAANVDTGEVLEDSWLQVMISGKSVGSFPQGDY
jgi:hypothetical protein